MDQDDALSNAEAPELRKEPRLRPHRTKLLVVGLVAALAAAAAVVSTTGVLDRGGAADGGVDNAYPTSTAVVTRTTLFSETQVDATLGYAGSSTIVEPAGTAPSALAQAEQQVMSDRAALDAANATLADDTNALDRIRATLSAARQKQAVDCRGNNAAETSTSGGDGTGGGGGSAPCTAASQAVSADEETEAADLAKVSNDQRSVAAAAAALAAAEASLSDAQSSATVYGQSSTYTMLPAVGQVVERGQSLYAISGRPIVLLYGSVSPWRAFAAGMAPGRDVAELNANLRALGYGDGLTGDRFTESTAAAIRAFQSARGLPTTGSLLLGSVVFEPGAVRVTSVTPTVGAAVQAGPVLDVTSTRREVTIALDAAQQGDVRVGDPVTITLPSNETTPGRVSSVGTVATAPASDSGNGGGGSPTVEVLVTPTDPAATGRLDKAPVQVSIITAQARNVLAAPVAALLALAGGGYAVEEVGAGGVRHLVPVRLGLFDDTHGLVEVSGPGLAPGRRVVVPGT